MERRVEEREMREEMWEEMRETWSGWRSNRVVESQTE